MQKRFFVDNFCLTVPEKIIGEHFCVSKKNPVSKNFMHQRGISRFSVESLLPHSTENFRRETLLCLRKFLVSKNVKDKRGGRYHDFSSKLFCLTAPKHFVEETFCGVFQKIFCFSIETFRRRALPGSRENRESFMLIRPPPPASPFI